VKKLLIWSLVVWGSYTLWSCANPTTLTGGKKDKTPPKVVKDGALPKNEQTNFVKQDITFTFDEWVKLNDVANEVVVSPPLAKNPEIKIKNKELIFAFHPDEVLKEDVTYTINFGEAVKDLTEGNPAKLKYVFSTGDLIDSLVVDGFVIDAIKKEPVKDCLVMLYKNLSDTIVRTETPYYFDKTDENGRFEIGNVKEGSYKIFALAEDQGRRYLFDSETEGIGFLEEPVVVNDTLGKGIGLQIFKEKEELTLKGEKLVQYGHAKFIFNREPYELDISHEDVGQDLRYEYRKDTIHIWYDTEDPFLVYLANDTLWTDTVQIKSLSKDEFVKTAKLNLKNSHDKAKKVNRKDGIRLEFFSPLSIINNNLVDLYADTTQTIIDAAIEIDTTGFGVNVIADWTQSIPYELVLLPGAVENRYGAVNDTINLSYLMQSDEDFGEIKIVVTELDSTSNYILKLVTKSNREINRYIIRDQSNYSVDIPFMEPGDYKVEVIQDTNKNDRWDTGSYNNRRYPEIIYTQNLEKLRANWTLEVEVTPGFLNN